MHARPTWPQPARRVLVPPPQSSWRASLRLACPPPRAAPPDVDSSDYTDPTHCSPAALAVLDSSVSTSSRLLACNTTCNLGLQHGGRGQAKRVEVLRDQGTRFHHRRVRIRAKRLVYIHVGRYRGRIKPRPYALGRASRPRRTLTTTCRAHSSRGSFCSARLPAVVVSVGNAAGQRGGWEERGGGDAAHERGRG